jgi:hypothetical protein
MQTYMLGSLNLLFISAPETAMRDEQKTAHAQNADRVGNEALTTSIRCPEIKYIPQGGIRFAKQFSGENSMHYLLGRR